MMKEVIAGARAPPAARMRIVAIADDMQVKTTVETRCGETGDKEVIMQKIVYNASLFGFVHHHEALSCLIFVPWATVTEIVITRFGKYKVRNRSCMFSLPFGRWCPYMYSVVVLV